MQDKNELMFHEKTLISIVKSHNDMNVQLTSCPYEIQMLTNFKFFVCHLLLQR